MKWLYEECNSAWWFLAYVALGIAFVTVVLSVIAICLILKGH